MSRIPSFGKIISEKNDQIEALLASNKHLQELVLELTAALEKSTARLKKSDEKKFWRGLLP